MRWRVLMGKYNKASTSTFLVLLSTTFLLSACGGGTNFLARGGGPLKSEEVSPSEVSQDGGGSTTYQDIPSAPSEGLSPLFNGVLGMPISYRSLAALPPDPSGYTAVTDYDGDGIPNEQEVGGVYHPALADC